MFEQFTSSIARLFSGNGSIAGAGFLVSSRHLLTCAHVVADALAIRRETVDKPSGKVSFDLPLVAAGKRYTAQVVVWEALRYDAAIGADVGDVALLELDEALPATIRQAPFSQVAQPLDQSCWAFGFPRYHDAGVWSPGLLRAANASGWIQLEDKGASAYFVQPGFSGGPIWSETEQSIVGMVAAAERHDPKTPNKRRVAFMIPVKQLKEAWPALSIVKPVKPIELEETVGKFTATGTARTYAARVQQGVVAQDNSVAVGQQSIYVGRDATESVHIIGDHNTIIRHFTDGLARLPTNYSTRIKNFLHEYLGTPQQPVPFGGRKAELDALEEWLSNPSAPPYALLAAEAGRGKSALLTRWAQSQIARNSAHIVFIPVSIRFNTALASVTFTALAARLGDVYGEPVKWANLSAEQWRGVCQNYLSRTPPDGKPLVVILDGLDEAADWRAGEDLFPRQPGSGVRAVVSARYLAGDVDETGWRRRLGWTSDTLAVSLPIPTLTLAGVKDVLHKMGNPLDKLATKVDVVGELYRLSEGDPLLVRLYVEALQPVGERVVTMSPEDLPTIQPGLEGYFERWWEEQERQWEQQERDPLEKQQVLDFFNVCATALGPLFRNDIAAIAGRSLASGLRLKKIAKEVERFVIGDGKKQGYTFSHPRLGYYFWEQMIQSEQQTWETRFLDYGHHILEALNNGTCHPHHAPSYAIQYYGAHLERADAPSDAFYALVSEGWMRAWEALEGTHAGFLNDVERVWQRAKHKHDITMQIKCALCHSSVAALSANIPPHLLAQAVQYNLLTPRQTLMIAQQFPDKEQYTIALSKLIPFLPPKLLAEAFTAAREIQSDEWRAEAFSSLASHLPPELLREALTAACEIQSEGCSSSHLLP